MMGLAGTLGDMKEGVEETSALLLDAAAQSRARWAQRCADCQQIELAEDRG
jgi:hypothetical protein